MLVLLVIFMITAPLMTRGAAPPRSSCRAAAANAGETPLFLAGGDRPGPGRGSSSAPRSRPGFAQRVADAARLKAATTGRVLGSHGLRADHRPDGRR